MKTHAIYWKSTVTGTIGTGTKLFEKPEAERLATALNESYPDIDHEGVIPESPVPVPKDLNQPGPQVGEGLSTLPPP
jgi:hypothetical protein